jgi:hypothetical protein
MSKLSKIWKWEVNETTPRKLESLAGSQTMYHWTDVPMMLFGWYERSLYDEKEGGGVGCNASWL